MTPLPSLLKMYERIAREERKWKNRSELDGIRALCFAIPVPISAGLLVTLVELGYDLALCGAVALSVHSIMLPIAFLGYSQYAKRRARSLATTDDILNRERLVKEELEAELHYVERLNIGPGEKKRLMRRAIKEYEYQMQVIEDHRRLGSRSLSAEQILALRQGIRPALQSTIIAD